MKSILLRIAVVVLFLSLVLPASALTFEELAGTYVGHRTETSPSGTKRYDEIDVIGTDGSVVNYVYQDDVLVSVQSGTLTLNEDGTISVGDEGYLKQHGNHFEVFAYFSAVSTQVHVQGHRTKKDLVLP